MSHLELTVRARSLAELESQLRAIVKTEIEQMDQGSTMGLVLGWTLKRVG